MKHIVVLLFFLFCFIFSCIVMGRELKVSICQVRCIDSDISGNFSRIEKQVKEASEKGAEIALFPETVIIGWVNPNAYKYAEPIPGKFTERIGEMAKKYKILIGISLCEKVENGIYDSAVIIDKSGKILLKHRKINVLPELMNPPYISGKKEDITAVDTPLGRIGMMICADSFNDEHLKIMADKKPDFVYIPYGWAYRKEGWPEHGFELIKTVQKAAIKIGASVIGPNVVGEITQGPWKGRTYEGLSIASDEKGILLVQGKHNKEDVIIFNVTIGKK